ncbi:helix-turn-helix transcriptional regulator [Flaviflexus massiliensis]|uniref:helix-turn-helix transcriptional regulator n=1 Tax=Flaviflexus massiliensis TaxID=1522309 RepID=UPI0006D5A994|nr:hypothetical protein [Flaviflexus massiliensis]
MNGVAERLGISPTTGRNYYNRGRLPAPDARIGRDKGSTLGWLPETINEWNKQWPGRGNWSKT